jgi:hypothetical protein
MGIAVARARPTENERERIIRISLAIGTGTTGRWIVHGVYPVAFGVTVGERVVRRGGQCRIIWWRIQDRRSGKR